MFFKPTTGRNVVFNKKNQKNEEITNFFTLFISGKKTNLPILGAYKNC